MNLTFTYVEMPYAGLNWQTTLPTKYAFTLPTKYTHESS